MIIFTDGSTINNGKQYAKGKYAFYINDERYLSKNFCSLDTHKYSYATNQKCELLGIKLALQEIQETEETDLTIVSDSLYSIKCLTIWYKKWETNGWLSGKNPVKNKELIQEILDILKTKNVIFKHCNSHRVAPFNKQSEEYFIWYGNMKADKLCKIEK